MKKILMIAMGVLLGMNLTAGEFSVGDCFARWDGEQVTFGNGTFSRTVPVKGGAVACSKAKASAVGGECLEVKVGDTAYRLFPGLSGVLVIQAKAANLPDLSAAPKDYREAFKWNRETGRKLAQTGDRIIAESRNVLITVIEFADQTDSVNELYHERQWLLHTCERNRFISANVLDMRDPATDEGVVFLRLAPLPESRPDPYPDFLMTGSDRSVTAIANGYPVAELRYKGGDVGRKRVLNQFQRAIRPFDASRDGLFLSNTWGDGNRDSRINEEFILKEVAAGANLGVDVIQIDDGWQKGRTANSAVVKKGGGTWGKYWDVDPEFWKPCPERFPSGLSNVVMAARAKGMRFGLWFGPDSSNDFAHWQDDVKCLMDLHRDYGIDYFKMDSICIRTGIANERQRKLFDQVLEESNGKVTFDLDCTANIRPGYFGLMDIGPLFVENRYIKKNVDRLYYPHFTLRNLWHLSKVIDSVRLRMEILNPLRLPECYGDDPLRPSEWPPEVLFATVMTASPLGWFEVSGLAPETMDGLKPIVKMWKRERAELHGGVTHPIGNAPDGFAWTGFVTEAKDSIYVLLFRELNARENYALDLSAFNCGCKELRMIAGTGSAKLDGKTLQVRIPAKLGCVWVKVR